MTQLDYTFDSRIELERKDAREEERVNTERERKAKEETLQEKEKERQENMTRLRDPHGADGSQNGFFGF